MKIALRRVGNSLGILLPKSALDDWGLGEGDHFELTKHGIRPLLKPAFSHEVLDELKRRIAAAVVSQFSPRLIRAHSLANLHRWRENGVWSSAYDEWQQLMEQGSDGAVFAAMLGRDEEANRLRQSPPYVGLLPREQVRALNEEIAG